MRLRTPSQQAALAARQRGLYWSDRGYVSAPIQTHPNDLYVRVFPDGPFDRQWAGIQKNNAISGVGTHRMGGFWDPFYGTENALQTTRTRAGTVNRNNPVSMSVGAGPSAYQAQVQAYNEQANATPGLLATLVNKIRGR